jgi:hypothetical protein
MQTPQQGADATLTGVSTELVDGTHVRNYTDVITGSLTPEQRSLRASLAAHESWARTTDRQARTSKAREGRWQKYVARAREIHAGHDVTEEFIAEVAEHLRKADMRRMALKSAKSRRARTLAAKRTAVENRRAGA